MESGQLSSSLQIHPQRQPVESAPAQGLKELAFALIDCPFPRPKPMTETSVSPLTFSCGQFDVTVGPPSSPHVEIADSFGRAPRTLTHSCTLKEHNGNIFTSDAARVALDTSVEALSFAAGRWIGVCLVEGRDENDAQKWFRWGRTRISEPVDAASWFDLASSEWLSLVANGLLNLKDDKQAEEILHTALYWYTRSNTTAAGVDGSLILTLCALELLSWFVIVRRKRALTEDGYGQLANASERLRLMLTLVSIPRTFPSGLSELTTCAKREQWEDVADALVEARNYLAHPTKSRSGRRRETKDFPWYELWNAGQWLLELAILRLIDYSGQYHNCTKLRDFDRIDHAPWKSKQSV
jgi:hypothetical protein